MVKGLSFVLENAGSVEVLTPEQEKQVVNRIVEQDCQESRVELFNANLKLAAKISRELTFQESLADDIFNEACIGLWQATGKYDPLRGVKFTSFSGMIMRSAILNFILTQSKTIRIPQKRQAEIKRVRKFIEDFFEEYNAEPTSQHISDSLSLSLNKVNVAKSHTNCNLSFDKKYDNGNELLDIFYESQNEESNLKDLQNQIKRSFRELTEKERVVILKRYGLGGGESLKLREIGDILNMTKQRVDQISSQALGKIKKSFINNGIRSLEYI
jgi:RNA polymerase sigma factor (sigma-70 family)